MSARNLAGFLAAMIVMIAGAQADVFQSAEFRLSEGEESNAYVLLVDAPADAVTSLGASLPEGCAETAVERLSADLRMRLLYRFRCERALQGSDVVAFPWRLDGADVRISVNGRNDEFSVTGARGEIAFPVHAAPAAPKSLTEIMRQFLWQGALHIWFGWDHLAFVMCLCMIARGWRLLELVSLFTVGHSISLGLAFFGVVSILIPPVEAVIALSIALMAREALLKGPTAMPRGDQLKYSLVIAALGLIHGLGFASALSELGVAPGERWPALVFFNIGIELGQLIFVAGLLVFLTAVRRLAAGADVVLRRAALYGVGVIGAFWTIERVWGFGWA